MDIKQYKTHALFVWTKQVLVSSPKRRGAKLLCAEATFQGITSGFIFAPFLEHAQLLGQSLPGAMRSKIMKIIKYTLNLR